MLCRSLSINLKFIKLYDKLSNDLAFSFQFVSIMVEELISWILQNMRKGNWERR